MRRIALLFVPLFLLGCAHAPKPVLYPNAALERSGQPAANDAIAVCMQRADAAQLDESEGRAVKSAAGGALIGAAIGAAVGSVGGHAKRGAQYGAAGGATRGLFRGGGKEQGPIYQQYVNRCLAERGYEVIGWK